MAQNNFLLENAVANISGAMEADTISKHGRKSKSQMSRGIILLILCVPMFLLSSCGGHSSFVKGEGGRTTVQIADKISYDLAYDEVITILTRKFELDMISKESGYVKTKWQYTWVGKWGQKPQKDYRVRVTVRLSSERKRIDIQSEAEKLKGDYWIGGYDTRLLEEIRKDISGVVGY